MTHDDATLIANTHNTARYFVNTRSVAAIALLALAFVGFYAYQLAVVVDDAFQGVTEVVRGQDLLDSTPRQIHLQRALGLPTPDYLHLPLAVSDDGKKLGKRDGSDPLARQDPARSLLAALAFLGQQPPSMTSLDDIWSWAIEHWRIDRVPAGRGSGYTVPSS